MNITRNLFDKWVKANGGNIIDPYTVEVAGVTYYYRPLLNTIEGNGTSYTDIKNVPNPSGKPIKTSVVDRVEMKASNNKVVITKDNPIMRTIATAKEEAPLVLEEVTSNLPAFTAFIAEFFTDAESIALLTSVIAGINNVSLEDIITNLQE